LPAPPIRRSDPPLPKSVSLPDPPVKVLAKELPSPVKAPVPVNVRFSTLASRK
jgi:hypothetical protein